MRVLVAVASNRTRHELTRALGAKGHEVITSTSRGEELLLAIERTTPIHVALLSQAALGSGWPKVLRQLRRRAPGVRVVVLLRPGAERQWRLAMLAGAFDALPGSAHGNEVLAGLCRALDSPAQRRPHEPSRGSGAAGTAGSSPVPAFAARASDRGSGTAEGRLGRPPASLPGEEGPR